MCLHVYGIRFALERLNLVRGIFQLIDQNYVYKNDHMTKMTETKGIKRMKEDDDIDYEELDEKTFGNSMHLSTDPPPQHKFKLGA